MWWMKGIIDENGAPRAKHLPTASISVDASTTRIGGRASVSLNLHFLNRKTFELHKVNIATAAFELDPPVSDLDDIVQFAAFEERAVEMAAELGGSKAIR